MVHQAGTADPKRDQFCSRCGAVLLLKHVSIRYPEGASVRVLGSGITQQVDDKATCTRLVEIQEYEGAVVTVLSGDVLDDALEEVHGRLIRAEVDRMRSSVGVAVAAVLSGAIGVR